jgi:hypothetical protein
MLPWPEELARAQPSAASLCVPASNICLDLHGDPVAAQLIVYSDGNHHMALQATLKAFAEQQPESNSASCAGKAIRALSTAPRSITAKRHKRSPMAVPMLRSCSTIWG